MPRPTLSASPALNQALRKRRRGLHECTDADLGVLLRGFDVTDRVARDEILAEIRIRGFIMSPLEVEVGDKIIETAPLGGNLPAVVSAADTHSVTIDYGTEQVPGVPGSRYTKRLITSLRTGALKRA